MATTVRLDKAIAALTAKKINFEVLNKETGHVRAWNKRGRMFQFWTSTNRIYNSKRRGLWHFINLIQESEDAETNRKL